MPRSSASRGESRGTGVPSTRYVPALGGWTPARILISVDLPAPLSPSRQWTSPRRSRRLTSWRAATVPNRLLTPSSSRMWSARAMSPRPRDAAAHVVVEQHGDEQHQAQEHAEPVRIDVGIGEADLHDAEDQRAEAGPDHRAVAAGEQAAADNGGDDRLELLLQAAVGGGRSDVADLQHREQPAAERGEHEQRDLHAGDGDAGVLGGARVTAHREDP